MSRAGKYPVKIAEGVSVAIADNALVVKGPKGELKLPLDTKNAGLVDIVIEEGQVVINPKMQKKNHHVQCGAQWHAMFVMLSKAYQKALKNQCI